MPSSDWLAEAQVQANKDQPRPEGDDEDALAEAWESQTLENENYHEGAEQGPGEEPRSGSSVGQARVATERRRQDESAR